MSPATSPVGPGTERDRGGTDPVARMISARPAARRCSDAAEEIFPVSVAHAPVGGESEEPTTATSPHPAWRTWDTAL